MGTISLRPEDIGRCPGVFAEICCAEITSVAPPYGANIVSRKLRLTKNHCGMLDPKLAFDSHADEADGGDKVDRPLQKSLWHPDSGE